MSYNLAFQKIKMTSLEAKTNLAHEKKKLFKCVKFKKKFISEARLKWHLVTIHEGNKPYQCIHCKKNFSFKRSLQKHIIIAHDGGPYECSECSDTFVNKALFKAHFLAHFHDKNFSDLPDEVMLKILTYLNFKDLAKCAKVSKRLRKVCKDKSLCGELAPYSAAMKRLCKDIEANVDQFKSKPIGPLGRHIKLTSEAAKNDQLRSLLEISLGQYRLKSFLVECKQDQIVLDRMMKKHYTARQPMIITRGHPRGRLPLRYDISSGKVPAWPTMVDYLIFQKDEVFNYFVDIAKIETVIVTDDVTAQRLFHR